MERSAGGAVTVLKPFVGVSGLLTLSHDLERISDYSLRSAVAGSTRMAREAGM